jgi:anti-sigma regulatory factor (Ser/Thr protein kinase)
MAQSLLSTTIHTQADLLALRRMLLARLERRVCSAGDVVAILLATHEATMNGLRFSRERPVFVSVHLYLDRAVVCVADGGSGFDCRPTPPALLLDDERSSGRDRHLMGSLMDRLDVVVGPFWLVVRMERHLRLAPRWLSQRPVLGGPCGQAQCRTTASQSRQSPLPLALVRSRPIPALDEADRVKDAMCRGDHGGPGL